MQNHIFLGGGTDVNTTYTFPTGVALKVPPATALDLNAHYFNKQTTNLTGENYINMYTVSQTNVLKEAQSINFANYNFSIPANSRKTITTDPGHLRLADPQQHGPGNRRIHRIAAAFQHINRRLGGQRM